MRPVSSPPAAESQPGSKRKRLHHRSPSDIDSSRQRTIQHSFSSQIKPAPQPAEKDSKARAYKRTRIESPPQTPSTSLPSTPRSGMYSFTSRQPSNGVVDPTASPSRTSPVARRLSGVKPIQGGHNAQMGAKKLVVKNLRKQTQLDTEEYFNTTWSRLDEALTQVLTGAHAALSLEDLYRNVENLCRQNKGSSVNSRLNDRLVKHLKSTVLTALRSDISADDVSVLRAVLSAWSAWTEQMKLVRCIFYYMDRSYLLSCSKTNLHDVCVAHFRAIIFEDPALNQKVVTGACQLVSSDRKKQSADRSTLQESINMFHALATYTSSFEPKLLAVTQKFVVAWADEASSAYDLATYVNETRSLITQEDERCVLLGLDSTTKRGIADLIEQYAIKAKVDYLVDASSLAELLDSNDTLALQHLYELLQICRLGEKLKPSFSAWVEKTGTSIIFDEKAQDDMVVRLLALKRRLDNTWANRFQKDSALGHGLREAFETFMNKTKKGASTWGTDNSKTGEMIAKYVDMLLRGGSKAIPTELTVSTTTTAADREDEDDAGLDEDAEVNAQLDQVLDLFRFIHGKAVFEAFYKKDLAKRLLMGRSASADAERSMLTRLKTECGAGFTQNLEQMFKDVELGREEMSGYKDKLEAVQSKPGLLDLSVNVLSAAAWPTYPDVPVIIPADVKTAIDHFEGYYKTKHSGRKLSWKHALAHCQMKAAFPKGTKEFVVSSFQAIVLLLFNNLASGDKLSYEHIKTVSGLPEAEVKRTLQSLACAKLRPLTKHPLGKEINPSDQFSVNLSFSHPRYRVRVNQVQLKETKQENKETHERVAEDRHFECQAAIVRIMKSRKTIGHSELVAEVITATRSRGVLAVSDIKKNIDRLIEKDYMEREDGNMYSYVA